MVMKITEEAQIYILFLKTIKEVINKRFAMNIKVKDTKRVEIQRGLR